MAGLLISNPTSLAFSLSLSTHKPLLLRPATASQSPKPPRFPISPAVRFPGAGDRLRRRERGLSLVTRAGPTTSSYIFAFVLPFSLIILTVFTSIRIADKLDRDFLEEVALNEAMREGGEEEESEYDLSLEQNATPRTRNRPKREV
ncbi:hypothetical protein UlMin_007433 [Ulmus minor]